MIASLVEKELTTPQQYPLTANALLLACNQASNRDPVVDYTAGDVARALDDLRAAHLVRFVLPSHGRSVVRYRHVLDEVLALDRRELAVLAVLLLRGPQTAGELRARGERLADTGTVDDVERTLEALAGRDPPLVERVSRRPGQKEDRWADLVRERPAGPRAAPVTPEDPGPQPGSPEGPAGGETPAGLAETVAALERSVAELRAELTELRASLGG